MSDTNLLHAAKLSLPVDVNGLARRLGIVVRTMHLDNNQSGFIRKEIHGGFTIGLNRGDGEKRQRFTLAHELGHYFLHSDLLEPGGEHFDRLYTGHNDSGVLSPSDESQANRFAAELLMPKAHVSRMWRANPTEHWRMAREFGVSSKAMAWRLVNLGLALKQEVDLQ